MLVPLALSLWQESRPSECHSTTTRPPRGEAAVLLSSFRQKWTNLGPEPWGWSHWCRVGDRCWCRLRCRCGKRAGRRSATRPQPGHPEARPRCCSRHSAKNGRIWDRSLGGGHIGAEWVIDVGAACAVAVAREPAVGVPLDHNQATPRRGRGVALVIPPKMDESGTGALGVVTLVPSG